jgi:hypothetical protein
MATVPTITTNTSPVTIQAYGNTTVTYSQILSQLGSYMFKVNKLSIVATNIQDLYIPFTIQNVDADGTTSQNVIAILPSQYQRITQVDADLFTEDIVFNSRTFLNFTMNPNSSITLLFDTQQWSSTELLDNKSKL